MRHSTLQNNQNNSLIAFPNAIHQKNKRKEYCEVNSLCSAAPYSIRSDENENPFNQISYS